MRPIRRDSAEHKDATVGGVKAAATPKQLRCMHSKQRGHIAAAASLAVFAALSFGKLRPAAALLLLVLLLRLRLLKLLLLLLRRLLLLLRRLLFFLGESLLVCLPEVSISIDRAGETLCAASLAEAPDVRLLLLLLRGRQPRT